MTDDRRWHHCTIHTYGAWLYGDCRGFRTRHHREHVEGDYKKPPPKGKYDGQLARSRRLLKQPPVVLPPDWRSLVGSAVAGRLAGLGGWVLCASCGGRHAHLLVKLPPELADEWVGLAKKHSWFIARDYGWRTKLWAKRGGVTPIRDRNHQRNTFWYILNHAKEGAWIADYRHAPPPQSPPVATGGL